jgi:2-polyprenyl-3-methyl-5-hydroxy-6-metoxy-1,4-benzoquinol methylase
MKRAYALALREVALALKEGGECLDCGAGDGHIFDEFLRKIGMNRSEYHGLEWDPSSVRAANTKNLNVIQHDLNKPIPFASDKFTCVVALSVLEHLLNGCQFMKECHRILKQGGSLILLTPNIATYFTAFLIMLGRMPSSGPHPDSEALIRSEEFYKVSSDVIKPDTESEAPLHRHLVVFSYLTLIKYLRMIGFSVVKGYGFGLYPFPNFLQPIFERIDPYHCHQMVFIAKK